MRWIVRTLVSLVIIGLTILAVLPHAETIRQEWQHLCQTWELVRGAVPTVTTEAAEPELPDMSIARDRTVLKPRARTFETAPSANGDPFLAEARRRASDDPEEAMHWLQVQSLSEDTLRGMLEIVAVWAAEDSESALLWLESNAQGLARHATIQSGIELWAQQAPNTAAAWIDGMANDGSKVTAAKTLATHWVAQSTAEASQWVEQLPNGSLRDETSAALVQSWMAIDPEAAAIWALTQAEFQGNKSLLNQSIKHYVQASPAGAEAFVRSLNDDNLAAETIETFVRTLAETDPTQAMDWQTSLSQSDQIYNPESPAIIMEEWSRTDSVAASTWLNDTPSGPQRDAAIVGFTNTMLNFDPEAAAAWSNTISAPEQRFEQLNRSILNWAQSQPNEALQWVQEADLEPDVRHALASQIDAD